MFGPACDPLGENPYTARIHRSEAGPESVYLGRVGTQLQRLAPTDVEQGKALLGRWITGYWIVLVVLVIIIWDMVFKPGLGG